MCVTSPVPEPMPRADVREPYDVERPYSTYTEVERPFGFTVPWTVAAVAPMAMTGPVTTVGPESVLNVRSSPLTVPALFTATRRKW